MVNVQEASNGSLYVYAREVYDFISPGRDFSTWFGKRREQFLNREGCDYWELSEFPYTLSEPLKHLPVFSSEEISPAGGKLESSKPGPKPREYILTLDFAKHLAMMENNDKVFKVRDCFIKCEKALYNVVSAIL